MKFYQELGKGKDMLRTTNKDSDWTPKYYDIFVGLFVAFIILSAITTPKLFSLCGFIFPAAVIFFPISCIIGDVLTEIYGFNRTRRAIWVGFACNILMMLATTIVIMLPPLDFNIDTHNSFKALFAQVPRVVLASLTAYLFGEFVNSFVMSKMKKFQSAKFFGVRAILSTIAGQFFDTIIVVIIAFYGVYENHMLVTMMFSVWGFKVLYEMIALPLTTLLVKHIKKKEGVEHFDNQELKLL